MTHKTMTMATWYRGMDLVTVAEDLGIDANTTHSDLSGIATNIECLCRHDRDVILTDSISFCKSILAQIKTSTRESN